jgi:glycosyltransferase involved in cell wall biosynthesis
MFRILYIAYPLLTVSEESAGGAEQVLWTLEQEMAAQGITTAVAASAGSRVSGALCSTGAACTQPDDFERRNHEHQERAIEFARAGQFDLVHDQSGSFWPRAREIDMLVLATLHLPRHFYPANCFVDLPANVSFNCVSASQAREFSDLKSSPAVVPNGILLERFQPSFEVRNGWLWLGRICEEKGPHLALDIAAHSGLPITLAGQIYPFTYHQQYFEREIAPRLAKMPSATWIPSPSSSQKRRLLREARAVLITSLVDETSSLVAKEAAASGTPVIAFRRGALAGIIQDGVTGFVVEGVDEAIQAMSKIEHIKPEACVRYAQEHFSSRAMAQEYATIYDRLLQLDHSPSSPHRRPLSC